MGPGYDRSSANGQLSGNPPATSSLEDSEVGARSPQGQGRVQA
jgi:hypothetical protein